ncbi:MAG TPA: PspC domain-containing protein [Anaeromyxobacteraceae bacterium]|nr:PspC domain-containing protein [Anaeromyxobacteraceae bacterium]
MVCPYCRTENHPAATRCAACASWLVDPPPVREWTRAREGKMIAGISRGLSARFGIPVAAIRLLFLLSSLLGGWGLLVYLALWIAMPLEPPVRAALPAYLPPEPARAAGAPGGGSPPSA